MLLVCLAMIVSLVGDLGSRAIAASDPPSITGQPTNATIAAGGNTSFTVIASNTNSYQWQVDEGPGFINISDAVPYSGATTSTLSITGATMDMDGYSYRVIATGDKSPAATSNSASLTVNTLTHAPEPTINVQPVLEQEVDEKQPPIILSVGATGTGTLSYQWYRYDDASLSNGFVIPNATSDSFTVSTVNPLEYYYRVVVTNTDNTATVTQTASVTSDLVHVKVKALANALPPTINTPPVGQTVTVGDPTVTLSVAATATPPGTLSYQWRRFNDNSYSGGIAFPETTSASFTVPTTHALEYYYDVIVTNTDETVPGNTKASVTSSLAHVVVEELPNLVHAAAPIIDEQPDNEMVDQREPVTLIVEASITGSGLGTLTYQWYRITDDGSVPMNGATGTSFNVPTAGAGVENYYVVVTNTDDDATGNKTASVTSRTVTVTVNALANAAQPVIDTQPVSDTVVNQREPVTLIVAASIPVNGNGDLSYQWYRSEDNSFIGGFAMNNATGDSLTVPTAGAGEFYYYVIVSNNDELAPGITTASVTSSIVKVTVNPLEDAVQPVIDLQPVGLTVNEDDSAILSIEASVSGEGTLSYQWYRNDVNDINHSSAVMNATGSTFAVPTSTAHESYYYAVVTNTNPNVPGYTTARATSGIVKVKVNANAPKPVFITQPHNQTVYEGSSLTLSVEANVIGEGTLSYQWYQNSTNSTVGGTAIEGATSASHTMTASSAGIFYYYVVVTNTDPSAPGYKTSVSTSYVAKVKVNLHTYTIEAIADQTAKALVQGYESGTQETKTILVANTGTGNLLNLSASLSGANADDFVLTQPAATLNSGSPAASFTVKAKDGLAAGTYTATVTVSADHLTSVTFTVTQVVDAPEVPVYPDYPTDGGNTQPNTTGVDVLVNGKAESAGTATTTQVDGQTITTVVMDAKKLNDRLAAEGQGAVITIPVSSQSDRVIAELDGQMIRNLEQKQAVVVFKAKDATYTLPAGQLNIGSIAEKFGKDVQLQDIKIQIEISTPEADMVKVVENSAAKGELTIVIPPLEFTVKATYGGTTVEVTNFNAYVERTIAVPDGVDHNKITTGVVVDPDGTVRHVPTKVVQIEGKYYVVINSLTNSTYTVVWHPLEFSDVAGHWAKTIINDMGSRMVIESTDKGIFNPDQDITRAEFAAIIVRGLGIKAESGTTPFKDTESSAWYSSVVNTAYANQLINGFEDGTFRPNDKITREQAMVIIAKAMTITGLKTTAAENALQSFTDASDASAWAADSIAGSIQAGIVNGRSSAQLAPKAFITRAEVAAIVQRLLQKSDLI
ncbi:hypothetical protein GCM10010911_55290 [Paenibacillus nasutitermitis]|uniref:S-layer homology domain-containing protein n=2 Tax=Paenibacillus nasutitermitis TaxID=1652958 RepID=A0A916ZE05_9BACL|nr:hypothetical protein GCM10010911_55290 [Paenibacillus nasutitermitis]